MSVHGSVISREPCPECGSRDNVARYEDGYAKCFGQGCDWWEGDGHSVGPRPAPAGVTPLAPLTYTPLTARKVSEETCSRFKYGVYEGEQYATYYNEAGQPVAQKVRSRDKRFRWVGDSSAVGFFGQQLWRPQRKLIITEGEIDALSYAEATKCRWPVVSVPNGAQSAAKVVRDQLDWLEGFAEVIFLFDMDDPGQEAAAECAELLSPGKAYLGVLPRKDPSEVLVQLGASELSKAAFTARPYMPGGVVNGRDLWEQVRDASFSKDADYPWPTLNFPTHGLRGGELVTLCAGSGIGKSTACREIAYSLLGQGKTVGYVALEESVERTALGIMSIEANVPMHLNDDVPEDTKKAAFDATLGSGRFYLYDHWGSVQSNKLVSKLRSMIKGCGVEFIVLDHISIVVSGLETANERKDLDVAMTNLRSLAEETGAGIIIVSHLKRVQGRAFERGAEIQLSDLRGSAALEQLSDMVLALERDQQDEEAGNRIVLRLLKNRFSGETGEAGELIYCKKTGRLLEADPFGEDLDGGESTGDRDF